MALILLLHWQALLFLIPSALTIATNFAWLGWSGATLNIATAAVATIAVGVGLDYITCFTFCIREALDQRLGYLDAIRFALPQPAALRSASRWRSRSAMPKCWRRRAISSTTGLQCCAGHHTGLAGRHIVVFPFALRLLRPRFTPHVDMFPDWNEATAELLPMVMLAEDRSLG